MPPVSEAAKSEMAAAAGGTDRLSALPDDVLHRVLSFLPSDEAVETCLLARRWRHVWKSARALRVSGSAYQSAYGLNKFVNSLLLFRANDSRADVDVVEIDSFDGDASDDDADSCEAFRYLELWIRYGLSSKARVLCVRNNTGDVDRWCLPLQFVTSTHLKVLELYNVQLKVSRLDFSSCPALEDLRMEECDVDEATTILSNSVKRLSMKSCYFVRDIRPEISVPNLVFMELADYCGCTPRLQSMPMLVSAFIRLSGDPDCYDDTEDCACVLLGGVSNATNLELTVAVQEVPIFRKDLTWCPVFSKLKTLLLSDWCVTYNLRALICFLQHSPILEKLTLQLSKTLGYAVDEGVEYEYDMKDPFQMDHLTVEVKCHNADNERISRLLYDLEFFGVPRNQIKIRQPPKLIMSKYLVGDIRPTATASFSFEQEETSYAVDAAASSDSTDAASFDSTVYID
ncbi:hypothetical protein U9M48_004447 [Paspalum notatum var. saurae]|uniref:F-box domain-containing protein n=1 Tax=Paspalum notatum var. saurae TaxID=547442 RepID=A0AAQ3PJY9_PASNO